ncbi:DeoR/GlpR family DNA-binding transcription regulator [Anaerostipes hadrus]|uniref:DeoR/GlpR family DNA-binding transcription regulator n=1 Tax=Anaerostipes hadrus TaxID=649756 RepID=UPI001C017268|nr:DeoR/GlpR family DNA-binding transcription regulator [Anaerostipes hadrus]MBT9937713.1 DeoR family transcriptional regulator [Anaerostipes hadrus]
MNRRLKTLLERLDQDSILNVNELSSEFHVSSATIRRDLAQLETEGKVKRIPGGAVKPTTGSIVAVERDINISNKLQLNVSAKKKVCEMACKEIEDGECIFIDGGTSSSYMFELLQDRPITIVTTNHLCSSLIRSQIKARIIMVGGLYMTDFAMTYGATAIKQISEYNFDRCFITCVGVGLNENQSYATEIETKEIKSTACKKSKHRYLLTDHSKIDVIGFCTLKPLDYFDKIFCDQKNEGFEYPANFNFS